MPDIDAPQQFHLDQLKGLRAEIDEHIRHLRQIEVYAVTGMFVIWGWLGSHPSANQVIKIGAGVVPLVLVSLSWLKHYSTQKAISNVGNYIKTAECHFVLNNLGWENSPQRSEANRTFHNFNISFWLLLFIISLAAGGALLLEQ